MMNLQRFAIAGLAMMIVPVLAMAALAFSWPTALSTPVVLGLVTLIVIGIVCEIGSLPELAHRWAQRRLDKK